MVTLFFIQFHYLTYLKETESFVDDLFDSLREDTTGSKQVTFVPISRRISHRRDRDSGKCLITFTK